MSNLILQTDSYKLTHWKQYPSKTTRVYSYLESRGGLYDETVFFGLQYYLDYLANAQIMYSDLDEAQDICAAHFGSEDVFNTRGWLHILRKHNGYLPIRIKAVPEGTVLPTHNVLMTVENTDPEVPWVTNFIETMLLRVWYPITVATLSREVKKIIKQYLDETGDPSLLPFKLHDFGYRGVSSEESAALGGAAHMVNFQGSDTIAGIQLLQNHYDAEMPGFSIPASEHSTVTSWGKEHEADAYRNMLTSYPTGLVACVSDSYDIFTACASIWGGELREAVRQRQGTLVIRPDSGDPVTTVCNVLGILGERFGHLENRKGFKVLHPNVRVIQGDGVNPHSIREILRTMKALGWSADNIAFGMGGALLQQVNRDTLKFAFKCSSVVVDGQQRDVYKDPVTDPGKQSKRGELALIDVNGKFRTVTKNSAFDNGDDLLETVFEDGVVLKRHTLAEIRQRAE